MRHVAHVFLAECYIELIGVWACDLAAPHTCTTLEHILCLMHCNMHCNTHCTPKWILFERAQLTATHNGWDLVGWLSAHYTIRNTPQHTTIGMHGVWARTTGEGIDNVWQNKSSTCRVVPQPTAAPRQAHCNSLQHTATHCNTLQHAATRCNTLQHAATHYNMLQHTATYCTVLQHTGHCNLLQLTTTHWNTLAL